MDELRDKVARIIQLWDDDYATSKEVADQVLALPEIADAQKRIKELEREIDAMDGDLREAGYFD